MSGLKTLAGVVAFFLALHVIFVMPLNAFLDAVEIAPGSLPEVLIMLVLMPLPFLFLIWLGKLSGPQNEEQPTAYQRKWERIRAIKDERRAAKEREYQETHRQSWLSGPMDS